jgi:hypothetical protein
MSQITDIRIQHKVDTKVEWEKNNPILLDKEVGYERETGKYKIGDGIKDWNHLPYAEFGVKAATTLAGYGITDAYTKTEVDSKLISDNSSNNTVVTPKCFMPTNETIDKTNGEYFIYLDSTEGLVVGDNLIKAMYKNDIFTGW